MDPVFIFYTNRLLLRHHRVLFLITYIWPLFLPFVVPHSPKLALRGVTSLSDQKHQSNGRRQRSTDCWEPPWQITEKGIIVVLRERYGQHSCGFRRKLVCISSMHVITGNIQFLNILFFIDVDSWRYLHNWAELWCGYCSKVKFLALTPCGCISIRISLPKITPKKKAIFSFFLNIADYPADLLHFFGMFHYGKSPNENSRSVNYSEQWFSKQQQWHAACGGN